MYWGPFEEIARMHEEMDSLFGRMYSQNTRSMIGYGKENKSALVKPQVRSPAYHIQETETNIIAAFELPGAQKEDIDLVVNDDNIELSVESKKEKKHEDKEKGHYGYSYVSQSFYKRIPLPKRVISDKADAEYKSGVLRVEVPKEAKEERKSKKVNVK